MKLVNLLVWSSHAFSKSALQAPTSRACTAARNYSRCVIHICFPGDWCTCSPYTVQKNIPTIMLRTMDCSTTNTQVTFHSVISIHFSWFFSTKQCFIAGPQRPSWLEWGWSPANHRPQSGPSDPPETSMVRTNSSAARSFANACWCHDEIYNYAWIGYIEREWMRPIFCNSFPLIFPSYLCFCLLLPVILVLFDDISIPSAFEFIQMHPPRSWNACRHPSHLDQMDPNQLTASHHSTSLRLGGTVLKMGTWQSSMETKGYLSSHDL